jgi:hypothetical protein
MYRNIEIFLGKMGGCVTNSVKCDDEREGAPVQAGVKVRAASIEEGRVLGRK